METLLNWIRLNELDKLREYIRSLSNINSILIYDDDANLNLLHVTSAIDSPYRDQAMLCLLEEDKKIGNKLDINCKSGPGNDCWTAAHLSAAYGLESTLSILLDNGASVDSLDSNGLDVLDVATAFDQFRCVDLIRRKMKSKTFSKADLNKSCDTVFYSFDKQSIKDLSLDGPPIVKKVDAQVQTSGQFNNTFNGTFKLYSNAFDELNNEKTFSNKSIFINKPPSSASKVLDLNRHRKEFEKTKRLNSKLINEYSNQSLNKTVILNEIRKDLNSKAVSKSAAKKLGSNDKTITNKNERTINRSTNAIKNLRNEFDNVSLNKETSSNDESTEPFELSVSTIPLGENKELYIDNEFNVTFINETKNGLLNISRSEINGFEENDLQSSNELLNKLNKDLDLTLKHEDNVEGNKLSTFKDSPKNDTKNQCKTIELDEDVNQLDDTELFNELINYGFKPGPVNLNTRSVYIKKLIELKKVNEFNNKLNNKLIILNSKQNFQSTDSSLMFSKALRDLMNGKFDFRLAKEIETKFVQNFENESSSSKKYFNYLLLDPRRLGNLTKRALEENPKLINQLHFKSPNKKSASQFNNQSFDQYFNLALFKLFILAIFYIGKGQGNRPYSHLYDAAKLGQLQTRAKKMSNIEKLNRIKEVWDSNHGVISLHCFNNISSIESLTRECFMIDCIGLKFLTNIQIGQNRIKNLNWTKYEKDVLGTYLLYKAYNVLLINGERQIKRADIIS